MTRNRFNTSINKSFIQGNSISGFAVDLPNVSEGKFQFGFTKEEEGNEEKQRISGRILSKSGKKAGKGSSRSQLMEPESLSSDGLKFEMDAPLPQTWNEPSEPGQFMDNSVERFAMPQLHDSSGPEQQSGEQQARGADQSIQAEPEAVPARPESTGLLSLRFQIPTDGRRFDFVRGDGNAHLTLNVRSSDSRRWLIGILWAVGCVLAAVLLLRSLSGRGLIDRLLVLAVVVGFAGWLLFPGETGSVALVVGVLVGIVVSGRVIERSFRAMTIE